MTKSHDQAFVLRERVSSASRIQNSAGARVLAIAGAKGGSGKSSLAVNMATQLSDLGQNVLLFDADFGLGNTDILLGALPQKSLQDCISSNESLRSIVCPVKKGLSLIAAGSGNFDLANANPLLLEGLLLELEKLSDEYDWILIDSGSGIGEKSTNSLQYADEIFVLTTTDPTSLADSYATLKLILKRDPQAQVKILVNRVARLSEAQNVYNQMDYVCRKYLGRTVAFGGWIPEDERLLAAARSQKPVSELWPTCRYALSVRKVLDSMGVAKIHGKKGFKDVVRQLFGSVPWSEEGLSA